MFADSVLKYYFILYIKIYSETKSTVNIQKNKDLTSFLSLSPSIEADKHAFFNSVERIAADL